MCSVGNSTGLQAACATLVGAVLLVDVGTGSLCDMIADTSYPQFNASDLITASGKQLQNCSPPQPMALPSRSPKPGGTRARKVL